MKKIFLPFSLMICGVLLTGCFRNDRRVEEFSVPVMRSAECLDYLSGRLRGVEGVEQVTADFVTGTVIVTFDGLKLGYKNIEFVIAGAGFDVNETPAPESAKNELPVACK
jgi:copper chaperone CopZ